MGWKDKKVVLMMSTYHDTEMRNKVTVHKGGKQEVSKLASVLDNTKYMDSVDRSDHYCTMYAFIRW